MFLEYGLTVRESVYRPRGSSVRLICFDIGPLMTEVETIMGALGNLASRTRQIVPRLSRSSLGSARVTKAFQSHTPLQYYNVHTSILF